MPSVGVSMPERLYRRLESGRLRASAEGGVIITRAKYIRALVADGLRYRSQNAKKKEGRDPARSRPRASSPAPAEPTTGERVDV